MGILVNTHPLDAITGAAKMLTHEYWEEYVLYWATCLMAFLFLHQLIAVTIGILLGAEREKEKPPKFGGRYGWW